MIKTDLVATRDGVEDDKTFIYATWLRGLYYGDSWFSEIPKALFMSRYHQVIERILASPSTLVRVCCLKDDPDVILGYVVLSKDLTTVHFTFVKKAWRNIGIAKELVPSSVTTATHLTKTGLSLIKKRGNIHFNPFI